MTLGDIKKRLLEIMKEHYPTSKYRYYSNAVVEKFERPCFFTELSIDSSEALSSGAEHFLGNFSIEILQDVVNEQKALEIGSTLKTAFGRYFMVTLKDDKRAVKVINYDFDFIGTDDNVPTITVNLEWYDRVVRTETADVMEDIEVSINVEAEE